MAWLNSLRKKSHFVIPNGVCGERNLLFAWRFAKSRSLAALRMAANSIFPLAVQRTHAEVEIFYEIFYRDFVGVSLGALLAATNGTVTVLSSRTSMAVCSGILISLPFRATT